MGTLSADAFAASRPGRLVVWPRQPDVCSSSTALDDHASGHARFLRELVIDRDRSSRRLALAHPPDLATCWKLLRS